MTGERKPDPSSTLATLGLAGGLLLFGAGVILDSAPLLIIAALYALALILAAAAGRGPIA